ncbi:MAG: NfeD family protein [Actinomycetota bacterium]
MRRSALVLLILILAGTLIGAASAGADVVAQDEAPIVDVAEVFGVLDPQLTGFVLDRITEANRDGAQLLVLELDTPGALEVDVREIIDAIQASRVPVAVWIGPRAARARSAGALIAAAAHINAIGPSARLGPWHPAELSIDPDSPEGARARNEELALARSLAAARGRSDPEPYFDRVLGANASLDARAVDIVTPVVAELLTRSDGRTVTTAAGQVTLRLPTDEAVVRFLKPGPIKGLLHTLATPALAYVMLLGAAMLVAFEMFQPGFGVAGVSGLLLLAGAVWGLTVLPVSIVGLAAFSVGVALMSVDVAVNGLGIPTIGGTGLLIYGSLSMFPAPAGALGIRWWLVLIGIASVLIFFVPVMTFVRRSRLSPTEQKEARALIGQPGRVRSVLNPEGFVWVADELWRARSEEGDRVRVGEVVVVSGVEGSLLRVRRS